VVRSRAARPVTYWARPSVLRAQKEKPSRLDQPDHRLRFRVWRAEEGTVGRKRVCEQIVAGLKSSLASGEHVLSCGSVWATEYGGRVPLRFGDRSLLYVAVTEQRLIFVRAPRRRGLVTADRIVMAKRHAALELEKTRRLPLTLQLRIRVGDRKFVLEFPRRDRKVGQDVTTALGAPVTARELRRITPRGAFARRVRPIAEEIAWRLPQVAPWTARPAFAGALQSLAWVEAQVVLLRRWIDEHGILGDDGQPQAAVTLLHGLEARASTLRDELGLTPQSLARLLSSLATVATAGADNGGLAALHAEGQRIDAARHATLGPVGAKETSQRRN
jgi:hypothetical protein